MNPILPDKYFLADTEARVMPDGRLYLYGTCDEPEKPDFRTYKMRCFSTDDMKTWVDHGIVFRNDEEHYGIPWQHDTEAYAPDLVCVDGKYYFYMCGSKKIEGVAVADSPIGPFSDAEPVVGADGDSIDPTLLVDKDGKKYYFWGQFSLRGGELEDDMKTLKPETVRRDIITEWEHGFHEGASIRRRGDKYYIVYTDISRGKATCMSYAVADHPLGPYKKGGVIVDNVFCDPKTWNNHGSIEEFNGQWYVFYHRASQNRISCRRVCVEPIEFDADGMIKEVIQTSSGAEASLDISKGIPARAACKLMRHSYITVQDGGEVLKVLNEKHWGVPEWAEFKYIDFGDGTKDTFCVKVKGCGSITVKTEGNQVLCKMSFDHKDYQTASATIPSTAGIHRLWLSFDGAFDIKEFWTK